MIADTPTMMLMILVTCAGMGLAVLTVAWRQQTHDGLAWWGWALLLNTLAFTLFGAAVWLGQDGWIAAGNLMMAGTLASGLQAIALFQRRPCPRTWLVLPVTLAGVLSAWFVHQPAWRVPLIDAVFALQSAAMA